MSELEYVDVQTAQAARGVRLVVSGLAPSPWSQAAKGLFRVLGVPVLGVRANREDPQLAAWARNHNVPVPAPNALDVYTASFLTPLRDLSERDCPKLAPPLRNAFAVAREAIGDEVAPALITHCQRMLDRHLGWPILL